ATSAPKIWMMLPREIIRPAAGITAMTTIRALPSFCRNSKFSPLCLPPAEAAAAVFFMIPTSFLSRLHSVCEILRNRFRYLHCSAVRRKMQAFFRIQVYFLHLVQRKGLKFVGFFGRRSE